MTAAQRRMCPSGKFRYRSEQSAENNLAHIWRRPKPGRRLETRSYPCDRCNGWHLTSQEKRTDEAA